MKEYVPNQNIKGNKSKVINGNTEIKDEFQKLQNKCAFAEPQDSKALKDKSLKNIFAIGNNSEQETNIIPQVKIDENIINEMEMTDETQIIKDQLNINNNYLYNNQDENIKKLYIFDYINEIWENLILLESLYDYNYKKIIEIQTDINYKMRSLLIDYLISFQNKFYKSIKTIFLTINIIDRYISHKPILRSKFQLLGIAALFIASKHEEIIPRKIEEYILISGNSIQKEELFEMELNILNIIDFNLELPLCIEFFDLLSILYCFNENEKKLGYFLMEAIMIDMKCNLFNQSQLALSACYIIFSLKPTLYIQNPQINLIDTISEKYKVNKNIWNCFNLILDCSKKMYKFLDLKNKVHFKEIYKIYSDLFI